MAILFLMIVTPALAICLALLGLATLPSNPLGWFLFLTGMVYAAGIVIVTYLRKEQFWESRLNQDTIQEEHSDRSFWLITLGMVAVFYLSPLEYLYIEALLPRAVWAEVGGMVLVVLGTALWKRNSCLNILVSHIANMPTRPND
jgi:hypothetical protein